MNADELKARFWAWYNRNIQAGWYASAALLGGWLTVLIAWLPDGLNWAIEHADFFGQFVFPTMDPQTKALFVSFYVAFVAPPLRAKLQSWMQKKSVQQLASKGEVVPVAKPDKPAD